MKIYYLFVFSVILLTQSCEQKSEKMASEETVDVDGIRQIIETKNEQISNWYAEGQIDSIANHFAPYAIQMPPNMTPLKGRDAFIAAWKQNVQFGKWAFSLNTKELKVCGDMATELGSYTLDFTANENSPIPSMSDQGNYVVLWENIEGDRKVVWDAPVSEKPLAIPVAHATTVE